MPRTSTPAMRIAIACPASCTRTTIAKPNACFQPRRDQKAQQCCDRQHEPMIRKSFKAALRARCLLALPLDQCGAAAHADRRHDVFAKGAALQIIGNRERSSALSLLDRPSFQAPDQAVRRHRQLMRYDLVE